MLMATTVAPGITAPEGSVTVPVTAPVTVCAAPVATQSSTANNDPTHIRIKLIFNCNCAPTLLTHNSFCGSVICCQDGVWEIRVIFRNDKAIVYQSMIAVIGIWTHIDWKNHFYED
jgi:hypothetical protein